MLPTKFKISGNDKKLMTGSIEYVNVHIIHRVESKKHKN